jgi:hypothetical protein
LRANPSDSECRAATRIPKEKVESAFCSGVVGFIWENKDWVHSKETNHIVADGFSPEEVSATIATRGGLEPTMLTLAVVPSSDTKMLESNLPCTEKVGKLG